MFTNALDQLLISEEQECPDTFLNSWKRKRDEEEDDDIRLIHRAFNSSKSKQPPTKKKRAPSRNTSESVFMYVIDRESGSPRPDIPSDSLWWINYVLYPELMTPRMHSVCHSTPGRDL